MNELKIFENTEFGKLNILTIGDKVYFPATDCAKVLGYAEPEKAIRMHCKGVSKLDTPSNGGIQKKNYIPEGDLYRLIIRSNLPAAKQFERWVFDEVLPSIRKQGYYSAIPDEVLLEAVKSKLLLEGETFQTGLDQVKAELTDARWEQMRELWENHELGDFTGVEQRIKGIWKEDKVGCAKARNHFWRLVRDGGLVGYGSLKWSRPTERRYNGRRPKELDDPAVLDHLTEQYKDMLLSEYRKYCEMVKEVPFLEARLKIANKEIERLQGAMHQRSAVV